MATVDGYTKAHMDTLVDEVIEDATIDGSGNLIMTRHSGATFNAGSVVGPVTSGIIICTSTTRPTPHEGLAIYETDTNRIYVWQGSLWRWMWSANGENKVSVIVEVSTNNDTGSGTTWPTGLQVSVPIPEWAKSFEATALLGQAQQVTDDSNTELSILLASRVIGHKRIRWTTFGPTNERDIIIMGKAAVDDMAGTTQLFRVTGNVLSGTGALRLDNESVCVLKGEFTDP